MKRCANPLCRRWLPASGFTRHPSGGLQPYCRECNSREPTRLHLLRIAAQKRERRLYDEAMGR